MDFAGFFSKDANGSSSVDQVLEHHFTNIEQGNFDANAFCTDLQALPAGDINYRECVQSMMNITKEKIRGTTNYKMVHNLEKMMDVLLDNFTTNKANICEVLFFPSIENEARIIEYLKSARKSIHVCMFTVTNEHLCTALLDAHLRGVSVKLITDDEEVRIMGTNVRDLSEEGITVRTDNSKQSLMHNKFVIIDKKIIMTGSYNWTVRATKANQENVVIMDNPYLTETFTKEFDKLWAQFTPQGFSALEGKHQKKTRLYEKYQKALAKVAKQEKALKETIKNAEFKATDEPELNPNSKKIAKASKNKDPSQRNKKFKDNFLYDSEEEEEEEVDPANRSNMAKNFLKIILTLFYIFSLLVFAQYSAGNSNGYPLTN